MDKFMNLINNYFYRMSHLILAVKSDHIFYINKFYSIKKKIFDFFTNLT